MKSNSVRLCSSGIGLIEVLITTVVIALGLLAVARFQVGVIGESRDNKALVEARNFCESGLEEFRGAVARVTQDADGNDVFWATTVGSPSTDTYVGKSATYTRVIAVENLPLPGEATAPSDDAVREKRITATCSWDGAEQPVVLQTVLSLHGANSSALAVGLGGGGGPAISPSLNAGSSDDISQTVPLPPDLIGSAAGEVVEINGDFFVVQSNGLTASKSELCSRLDPQPAPFENGLRSRRVDVDGFAGMEGIELFEARSAVGGDVCIPRVRFNGGVVVPIRGVVHSRISTRVGDTFLPVDLFTLNVSESGAYCVFSPEPDATSAPYTCYVGGNCAHGPEGINDADVTQCPSSRPAGILGNVGEGGWRGRVGLLNVANAGYNTCFSEEVTGPAETRDTARSYFSLNIGPDLALGTADDRSQGLNQPYSCQDFLIVDGVNSPQAAALSKVCQEQAATVGGLRLASKSISRDINTGSNANVYDPEINIDDCLDPPGVQYTITGLLENQVGLPLVEVTDGGSTWQCEVYLGSYSCTFTTVRNAVQIWAFEGAAKYPEASTCIILDLDPANPATTLNSGCTITFPEEKNSIYRISGFITGSEIGSELSAAGGIVELGALYASITVGCSVGDFAGTGRPYHCEFVAPENITQVTLYAKPGSQYNIAFENDLRDVALTGSTEEERLQIDGPDLTVTSVATYQLSGTIRVLAIGGGEATAPSVNPEGSLGCTGPTPGGELRQNKNATYSCNILSGPRKVTYSISPGCSKSTRNAPGSKYRITSGSETSDAGSLVIDLGNVNANQTVDVSISLTDIPCG